MTISITWRVVLGQRRRQQGWHGARRVGGCEVDQPGHDRQDRVVGGRTEREQPLPIAHQGDGSPCYLVGQGVMFGRPDDLDPGRPKPASHFRRASTRSADRSKPPINLRRRPGPSRSAALPAASPSAQSRRSTPAPSAAITSTTIPDPWVRACMLSASVITTPSKPTLFLSRPSTTSADSELGRSSLQVKPEGRSGRPSPAGTGVHRGTERHQLDLLEPLWSWSRTGSS